MYPKVADPVTIHRQLFIDGLKKNYSLLRKSIFNNKSIRIYFLHRLHLYQENKNLYEMISIKYKYLECLLLKEQQINL